MPEIFLIIPAHNEETVIGTTLERLKNAPAKVVVVADHCSDDTAKIASSMGVEVIIHNKDKDSTKAKALATAIERLKSRKWQYLLILDADNTLSDNFWRILPRILSCSPPVLQVEVRPANKRISLSTKMITVLYGFLNRIVQRGSSVIGLGARLCGTGMLFRRDVVLKTVPWSNEMGLVEDMEYLIRLAEKDIKPMWADCICVFDEKPRAYKAAIVQGSRWLRGRAKLVKQLKRLFSKKPFIAAALAWTLVPKPVFWSSVALALINYLGHYVSWTLLVPLCITPWCCWIVPSFVYKDYRVGVEAILFPFWQMTSQVHHAIQALWDRGKGWRPTKHYGIYKDG